jgi:hypothetical protein
MQQPTAVLGKPLPNLVREGSNPTKFFFCTRNANKKNKGCHGQTAPPPHKKMLEKTTKNSVG